MRISDRGGRGVLPLILLLGFMAFNVYAGGGGDSPATFDPNAQLARAETLLADGRLDEAIEVLVAVARTDPEQMERVQKLILEIQLRKNVIDDQFTVLIAALNEGNYTQAAEIITIIKNIDKDPNRNTLNKLILAINSISKSVNNDIRDRFFDSGNILLAAGDYIKAVNEYGEGFIRDENVPDQRYTEPYSNYIQRALGQSDFVAYENDPVREDLVRLAYSTVGLEGETTVGALNSALDAWKDSTGQLPATAESLSALIRTSPVGGWAAAAAGLENNLSIAAEDIARVKKLTTDLDLIWQRLIEALDDIPEDFRYERIGQFLNGRVGENHNGIVAAEQEGILLAMELQWESSFLSMADAMNARLGEILTTARSDYRNVNWNGAGANFGSVTSAAAELLGFLETTKPYLSSQPGKNTRFSGPVEALSAYGEYVAAASEVWTELVALGRIQTVTGAGGFQNISFDTMDTEADAVQTAIDRVLELAEVWNATDSDLKLLPGAGTEAVRDIDTALRSDLSAMVDVFQKQRLDLYINAIQPLYAALEKNAGEAAAVNLVEIRVLINLDPVLQEGELPVRRPTAALNLIAPALVRLNNVEKSLVDFDNVLKELLNRRPPLASPEELQGYKEKARGLLLSTVGLRDALSKQNKDATALANSARRAEVTAKNVLAKVVANLNSAAAAVTLGERNNDIAEFNRAVDLYNAVDGDLNDVDSLYLEVLVNDEDLALSSGLDETRTIFRNRTQREKSRVAVSVKQNAIAEGRTAYEDGRYSYAKIVLTQAQEFYRRTYNEEDPEIAGWIRRVDNALKALEKTVIPPSDPLFPEMNQYLNLANRYYREGLRIKAASPGSADILRNFTAARDLLGQVLLIFPGNRAAQLLESRILWETDADKAGQEAAALIQRAETAIRSRNVDELVGQNENSGIISELYILKDIRPGYPNLDNLIVRAEIAAGIRPEPLDPAKVAESRGLSDQAWTIFLNLGDAGAERALELLNQALAIWIDNQEASDRKNRILLNIRPGVLPAFPPELLDLVNRFNQFFAQQNYIVCKALLDRILNDYGRFRNDPRIVDLARKLEPWL